jgi:hypothetical protein
MSKAKPARLSDRRCKECGRRLRIYTQRNRNKKSGKLYVYDTLKCGHCTNHKAVLNRLKRLDAALKTMVCGSIVDKIVFSSLG